MRRSAKPLLGCLIAGLLAVLVAPPSLGRDPIALGIASGRNTDPAAMDAWTTLLGRPLAAWTLWSTWGDRAGMRRCRPGAGICAFPTDLARAALDRGMTPIVIWQPTDPADPAAGRFERYRAISSGGHDRYIRSWARAARDIGGPVIVRFAHEMNGAWFPWALTNFDNSPAAFRHAWRHVVRLFRREGADKVRFLWSPIQARCPTCSKAPYRAFYPGNRWVDYVGVSTHNWGDPIWTPMEGLIAEALPPMRRLTRTDRHPQGEPVILPEVASSHVGGDKAGWLRDGLQAVQERWPDPGHGQQPSRRPGQGSPDRVAAR